jgi:nucleoside phosphorylase
VKPLWGIVVALSHEWKGIRPLFVEKSSIRFQGIQIYEGRLGSKDVIAMVTGMGPERASRGIQFLLKQYPITHLVSTGYCGALKEGIKTGEGILADHIYSDLKGAKPLLGFKEMISQGKKVLDQQAIGSHIGKLFTSSHPILSVEEKNGIFKKFDSIAVDMESHAILSNVTEDKEKKIQSLMIRFVLDELHDKLPQSNMMNEVTGEVKPWTLMKSVVKNPVLLKELPILGKKAQLARKNLVSFIQGFFDTEEA